MHHPDRQEPPAATTGTRQRPRAGSPRRSDRAALALALALAAPLCTAGDAEPALLGDVYAGKVAPFLQQHCIACHGPEKQKAGIRYDRLASGFRPDDATLWTLVHEQVAAGEMPPSGRPQPSSAERAGLLAAIEQGSAALRTARGGGLRRLNRREAGGMLAELCGLDADLGASLVADGTTLGFDTAAESLRDTIQSVEALHAVVRKALDAVRWVDPPSAQRRTMALDLRKGERPPKGHGITADLGTLNPAFGAVLAPRGPGDEGGWRSARITGIGSSGLVRLSFTVWQRTPAGVCPPFLSYGYSGNSSRTGPSGLTAQLITGTAEQPQIVTILRFVEDLTVGERQEKDGRVERSIGLTWSNRLAVPAAWKPAKADEANPVAEVPWIFIPRIEVEYPCRIAWPGCDPSTLRDDEASAARVLERFLPRAFRRPVESPERERYLAIWRKRRAAGAGFDDAMRAAWEAALVSPGFHFLAVPDGRDRTRDQHAVAARLAAMLWAGLPDDGLRRAAAAGALVRGGALAGEIERLVADPRSDAFFRSFTVAWLDLTKPIRMPGGGKRDDARHYFGHLIDSLREEPVAYHALLVRQDQPARLLVDSGFALMNEATAAFYGYPRLVGPALRRVELRPDDPRGGGVLGMAAPQAMTTVSGSHWPIYRGAWALRTVLDLPPPPPPLDVPELNEASKENAKLPLRTLFARHSANPLCSSCHRSIDPLGFGFQNFDIAGRWRTQEHERYEGGLVVGDDSGAFTWKGVGATRPVDAAGAMPRGETFAGFAELRRRVATAYLDDVVRGWLKCVWLHGTGRQPDVADLREIRRIISEHRAAGHPLRRMLVAAISSPGFLAP